MTLEQVLCAERSSMSGARDIDSQSTWGHPETQPERRLQAWQSK